MNHPLLFGSLFSGVGGVDLGFQRAGLECRWQVEIDEHAQRILAKHWPHVTRFGDVRACGRHNLTAVDVIAGGFPCQDISKAGYHRGLSGERSGLWREFVRIIGEVRPPYVFVENVAALLNRGMGRVCGDLAALGYDADWSVISACALGAPHTRERLFIVAYADGLYGKAGVGSVSDGAPSHESTDHGARVGDWVEPFSGVRGVADGVPPWVDRSLRLERLGNAVVPAVAQCGAERILAHARGVLA